MSFKDLLLLNQKKERNYYWNNVYLFTQLFSYFAYQHKDDEDYIRLAYDAALRFKNIHPTIHTKKSMSNMHLMEITQCTMTIKNF